MRTSFDEIMKNRARTEECPIPGDFERQVKAVIEALPERRVRRVSRHIVQKTVAIAAVICLLAALGTSLAVAAAQTVDPLGAQLETWAAAGLATPVGVSDSSVGWTVTVDSVLGDSWYTYIICTLSRDDGAAIAPGEYGFHKWDFGIPEGNNSSGIHWLEDEDETDNQVPFGFYLTNYNRWDLCGYTLHLTLNGLNTASFTENWRMMMAGGGKWELEFTLPSEGSAEDFTPAVPLVIEGKEAVLDTVRVSPMEVWAEFSSAEGAFAVLNATLESYDQEQALANTPCFVLMDGTELHADGTGLGNGDGSYWDTGFRAPEGVTLAPADIVGMKIGDTVYPLTLH